jgi:hypothetical protein
MWFSISIEGATRGCDSSAIDQDPQWARLPGGVNCTLHLVGVGDIGMNVNTADPVGNGDTGVVLEINKDHANTRRSQSSCRRCAQA